MAMARAYGIRGLLALMAMLSVVLASCESIGLRQPGTAPSRALVERGKALYRENCQSCHGGETGGQLRDIPPPHNANGHTWHHPDQQIIDIILNGFSFSVERQKMPAFKDALSKEDARAILAYIKTWWTDEQRKWQAEVTAQSGQ